MPGVVSCKHVFGPIIAQSNSPLTGPTQAPSASHKCRLVQTRTSLQQSATWWSYAVRIKRASKKKCCHVQPQWSLGTQLQGNAAPYTEDLATKSALPESASRRCSAMASSSILTTDSMAGSHLMLAKRFRTAQMRLCGTK